MKKWLKVLIIASPIIAVLAIGGIVLAVTSITTPTSLNYSTSTAPTYMQDFTESHCSAMNTYDTVVLTDNRDNTQYQVRKMPDSKCWMIDNLKLAGGTTLNSTNTNLDDTVNAEFISTWGSLSDPIQTVATHGNGACTSDSTVTIVDGLGALTCDGSTTYSDDNDGFVAYSDPATGGSYYENCVAGTYSGTAESSLTGCGYLYNWYTATAGTGNYQTVANTNATASICPAGWHMPHNTSTNDFGVLNNAMATGATTGSVSNNSTTYANWFYNGPFQGSLSGTYFTSITNQGSRSYYWSAQANNATDAYNLFLLYNSVNPSSSTSGKHYGMALRCIL